jgi:hypothetical protein
VLSVRNSVAESGDAKWGQSSMLGSTRCAMSRAFSPD